MWGANYTLPFYLQIKMTPIAVGAGVPCMKEEWKSICTVQRNTISYLTSVWGSALMLRWIRLMHTFSRYFYNFITFLGSCYLQKKNPFQLHCWQKVVNSGLKRSTPRCLSGIYSTESSEDEKHYSMTSWLGYCTCGTGKVSVNFRSNIKELGYCFCFGIKQTERRHLQLTVREVVRGWGLDAKCQHHNLILTLLTRRDVHKATNSLIKIHDTVRGALSWQ